MWEEEGVYGRGRVKRVVRGKKGKMSHFLSSMDSVSYTHTHTHTGAREQNGEGAAREGEEQ